MSIFFSDHRVTYTKKVNAPHQNVLQFLQDPQAVMRLSPLIIDVQVDPKDPTKHTIVDNLVLFGFYKTKMTYHATITIHEDGMRAESQAGAGTRTISRYTARAISEGETEVQEEVNSFFLLLPFIKGVIAKAHNETLDQLAAKLEGTATCEPFVYPMNLLLLAAVIALFLVFWLLKRSSGELYGQFHLPFNKLPGDKPGALPRTEWLNMGYWKDTDVFPDATAALALKLVQAAECKPGGHVLDVGHGTGESLIFLLTHPSVPHPSRLTGITSLEVHHQRSKARVARLNHPVPVALHLGDAIYHPGQHDHPLDPSSDAHFDTVLALDCAYHFQTRATFLKQAHDQLRPDGSIALADICFAPGALQTRWTRCVTAVLRMMPRENMISTDEYLAQMHGIGYTDVRLEDCTEYVFPGFIRFLSTRGLSWQLFGQIFGIFAGAGARFVIVRGRRG
ncbi:S-adenosyl-L-methionine-dependent methyltransferase [Mycena crocata]|nr:S-adenosyl-L-methionine-dependent methyltransferase [Mycena crocata]